MGNTQLNFIYFLFIIGLDLSDPSGYESGQFSLLTSWPA